MKVVALLCFATLSVASFAGEAQERLASRMQAAVMGGQNLVEIRQILDEGFDVNSPIGCGTFSSVDGAIWAGNAAMLQLFLKAGAKPKALGEATFHANPETAYELCKALLEAGADPNERAWYMDDRKTNPAPLHQPLHQASFRGHRKVIELLLRQPGIELDTVNFDGRTPLMIAAERGHAEIIAALLAKGANPAVKNAGGKTAADFAREQVEKRVAILHMVADPLAAQPSTEAGARLSQTIPVR